MIQKILMTSGTCGSGRWGVWPGHLVQQIPERNEFLGGNDDARPNNASQGCGSTDEHLFGVGPKMRERETRERSHYLHVYWPVTTHLWGVVWVRNFGLM